MKKANILAMLVLALSLVNCSKDDDFEAVYSFTTETYTDMVKLNNTDDATKMANLFFDKKWFMTKTISGNGIEDTDAKAKALFNSIVEQANQELVKMKLNGNAILTYKCTRNNTTIDAEMEIAKQEWRYLGIKTTGETIPKTKMTITTNKKKGEIIEITISANEEDRKEIWIDLNNDKKFDKETEAVKEFNVSSSYKLASTTITIYGKATVLSVPNQNISKLDLTQNNNLEMLYCNNNDLENLDISKNKKLRFLFCYKNKIGQLSTENNTNLESLVAFSNQIESLAVSKNTKLKQLVCSGNKLSNIDISNNSSLERFSCRLNKIENLDVTKNLLLTSLDCASNNIRNLDVTKNTRLTELYCGYNKLSSLNVSKNNLLQKLWVDHNSIAVLDVVSNVDLFQLLCNNNKLSSLDVKENTKLTRLWCQENPDLKCIKINKSMDTSNDTNWRKDADAQFNINCK